MAHEYQVPPGSAIQDGLVDNEEEESESEEGGSSCRRGIIATVLIALSVVLLIGSAILVLELNVPGSLPWHRNEALVGSILQMDSRLPFGAPACNRSGPTQFSNISMTEPAAREAVEHLIELTKSLLSECQPGVGLSVGLHPESVLTGQARLTHSVAAAWKYAADCESVTYRLKVMPHGRSGWVGVVNHDLVTGQWRALPEAYRPKVCEISTGGGNNPTRVSDPENDPDVQRAAKFAVAELNYLRSSGSCNKSLAVLGLAGVEVASEQLTQDMAIALELSLNVAGTEGSPKAPVKAGVTVYSRFSVDRHNPPLQLATGLFGSGRFDICSDPALWGAALPSQKGVVVNRRLMAFGEVEDAATDATNRLVAEKHHYFRRRLLDSWVKPPVAFRHITSGQTPEDYDPRNDPAVAHCFSGIPVYDQGACGCCYAAATAQMLSLRQCIAAARGTPATSSTPAPAPAPTSQRRLGGGCPDDQHWSDPDGRSCSWYAEDPRERCALSDVGQLSYCKGACLTCPRDASNLDFSGSLQQYMYSTADLATCSCSDFDPVDGNPVTNCRQRSGCRGGSVNSIWDAWMRLTSRQLRRRSCMPLTIKCLSSEGVTNPLERLSSPYCARQQHLEEWDRPCSCIAPSKIPSKEPPCLHAPDECSTLSRPEMVFQLMSNVHMLSHEETVLNIRRHIAEQGPLYAGLSVSRGFQDFFSGTKKGNVYPGDNLPDIGGHAVTVIGWGRTTEAQPRGLGAGYLFWLFRNSWTDQWADGGHGRILAGKDIKGIESRMYAAMLGSFPDFSPPVCQWDRASFLPRVFPGGRLCRFQLKLSLQCTEDATLQLYWADATAGSSEADSGTVAVYTHRTAPFRCPGQTTCSVDGIDLVAAGFGLRSSTFRLKVRAWDASGLHSSNPSTFTLDALQGAETYWGQPICGSPGISCEGCAGAPTPDPKPPTNDTSKEQPSGDSGGLFGSLLAYCFPPTALVRLADGQERPAAALLPGDRLLSADGGAADFVLDFHMGHAGRMSEPTRFLRIEHARQRAGRPLIITGNHLVFAAGKGQLSTVPASELRVGDHLVVRTPAGASEEEGFSRIVAIDEVVLAGYAAPLAETGSLFVEDVLVSSYALLSEMQLELWRKGPELLRTYTQEIGHLAAAPFHLSYKFSKFLATVIPATWMPAAVATDTLIEGYLAFLSQLIDGVSSLLTWSPGVAEHQGREDCPAELRVPLVVPTKALLPHK